MLRVNNTKHVLVVLVSGLKPGFQLNVINPLDLAEVLSLTAFREVVHH